MSENVKTAQSTEIATLDARPARGALLAGSRVQAIVPQSMEDALRIATAVCKARMAPKGLDTPEACLVAIMHGMEIGLAPMAALQRIAVVNGRPTIWGDGAVGLVRASGLCEDLRETFTGKDDEFTAICEVKRRGQATLIVGRFSVADAKRAGLWSKQGPWTQYPKRMLQMRARAFALRDGFADVLGGLYLREEIDEQSVSAPVQRASLNGPQPIDAMIAEPPAADSATARNLTEEMDDPLQSLDALGPQVTKPTLPKGLARDLYTELQQDIASADSKQALKDWASNRRVDIDDLPPDWQQQLRNQYADRMLDFNHGPLIEDNQKEERHGQ